MTVRPFFSFGDLMATRSVFFLAWRSGKHQIILTLNCEGQPIGHQVVFFFFPLGDLVATKSFVFLLGDHLVATKWF